MYRVASRSFFRPSPATVRRATFVFFSTSFGAVCLLFAINQKVTRTLQSRSMASEILAPPETFTVGGHRGMGKNPPPLSDGGPAVYRPKERENTLLSLSRAAEAGADFVEFDVQVTKDGHPVLFHDNLIWTKQTVQGTETLLGSRIPSLTLEEFQRINTECIPRGKLLRKRKDGTEYEWREQDEDAMPTLEQVLMRVSPKLGFNIELKFPVDDAADVTDADVAHMLDHVIPVVKKGQATNRRYIFFSSFVPQAVIELKKREPSFEVYFLTVGKPDLFRDERMNTVETAIGVAADNALDGIVPEVDALLASDRAVDTARQSGLRILTWGDSNNDAKTVTLQKKRGVDGVIVDDIATALKASQLER